MPLSETKDQDFVEHDGARIWYAAYGSGAPVILLHGGLGHSGNWGYQVPAVVEQVIVPLSLTAAVTDTVPANSRRFSYDLMASDVLAVMDMLHIDKAALVGWSDGACTALVLASKFPERAAGVFFFACNMDPSGTKEIEFTLTLRRCFSRHVKDYKALSSTPDQFDEFS